MSETGKCISWLGHKFEGRYSSTPIEAGDRKLDIQGTHALDAATLLYTTRTYERDVCVRCGATIEKTLAEPAAKAS